MLVYRQTLRLFYSDMLAFCNLLLGVFQVMQYTTTDAYTFGTVWLHFDALIVWSKDKQYWGAFRRDYKGLHWSKVGV